MSDVVEVSVALLRKFANFANGLTPEQLSAIAAGELKFTLIETSKAKASAPSGLDTQEIRARLEASSSREEAAAYLDGLKLAVPAMKKLAVELGAQTVGATKKDQVRDRIVEHTVGYRLNSEALRGGTWRN